MSVRQAFCRNCGGLIEPDQAFCRACGAVVGVGQASDQPPDLRSVRRGLLIGAGFVGITAIVISIVVLSGGGGDLASTTIVGTDPVGTATTAAASTTATEPPTTTTTSTVPALIVDPRFVAPVPLVEPFFGGEYLAAGPGCPVVGDYPEEGRYHLGTDFPGDLGDEVRAIAPGSVVRVSTEGWGTGNVALVILHDDVGLGSFTAVYGNLWGDFAGTPLTGERVDAGQVIGVLGSAEPLPNLHLGIHPGGSEPARGGGFGTGQADCDLWIDDDGDGIPDRTNGFVDPVGFLTTP